MEQEVIERNKVIAEFMGVQWQMMNNRLFISDDNGQSWYGKLYDRDWDSLMWVVDKIEKELKLNVDIKTGDCGYHYCKIYKGKTIISDSFSPTSKIDAVNIALMETILWFNQQNK